ncbi:unnamed protein product [Ophioblennius macclurei]
MKSTVLFLVLSMVVLMAQPGECIFGLIVRGLVHAGKAIHGLIHGANDKVEVVELDKRSVEYRPGRLGFA